MKIQLKRSLVLDGPNAKQPTSAQMEYGELAVNYSTTDPAIFLKNDTDGIVRIGGAGYDYDDLVNTPTIGNGEITIETADNTEVGKFTVNQTGDTTITLPADITFSGDYDDLTNKPTIGDGSITINNADGSENASFTVNQTGDTTVTLPAGFSGDYDDLINQPTIGDGTITIEESDGTSVGTFTVNQAGATTITLPASSSFSGDYDDLTNKLTAGDGVDIDGSNVVSAVAQANKGVLVEAAGIRIGDNWSNIPALT